jgi:RNA polymerase sigma-70 factor (ECF subfamily)
VRGAAPSPDQDLARQREVVDAFLAASRAGDFEALLEVLDPDVVFRTDRAARPPITGAPAVARQILARGTRFAPLARPAVVNGAAGAVVGPPNAPIAIVGFTVVDGRIAGIDLVTDRRKLARLPRLG